MIDTTLLGAAMQDAYMGAIAASDVSADDALFWDTMALLFIEFHGEMLADDGIVMMPVAVAEEEALTGSDDEPVMLPEPPKKRHHKRHHHHKKDRGICTTEPCNEETRPCPYQEALDLAPAPQIAVTCVVPEGEDILLADEYTELPAHDVSERREEDQDYADYLDDEETRQEIDCMISEGGVTRAESDYV